MMRNAIVVAIVGLFSCTHEVDENHSYLPQDVKNALYTLDTEQCQEMLAVIDHYSRNEGDSMKLKAAYFLIKELPNQFYYSSEQLQKFDTLFDIIAAKPTAWKKNIPWYGNQIARIFDTLETKYGPCCDVEVVNDKDLLTSQMLEQNIELAFASWSHPWARHYTFEKFCEFILPYRSRNEALESWRPKYHARYESLATQLKDSTNLLELAKRINDSSQLQYQKGISRYPVMVSPSNLLKTSFADCYSIANHKLFAMRSMGIAASIDFVPLWGNGYNGHYWNALYDTVGKPLSFMVAVNDVQAQTAYNWTLTKVYRYTYSSNPEVKELLMQTDGNCPPFFLNSSYIDVTDEYVKTSSATIQLADNPKFKNHQYVYLCQFNRGWVAVDFALIKDNTATFDKLGRNACYNIMYYDNGNFHAAALPLIAFNDGSIQAIQHDNATQTVKMNRKCHMEIRKENWLKSLVGAQIQVSDDSMFQSHVTLYTIKAKPTQYLETVHVTIHKPFRYARLAFSSEEQKIAYWGDGACIAELAFLDKNGKKIDGTPFGTPGKTFNEYTADKVFDGNPLTFFEDSREQVTKYVGLKLKDPQVIQTVQYQARNDLNNVQIGDLYELMYYNGEEFISLGKKSASDTLLVYENAPVNALFWLKNLSHGTEERIFTYENDRQIWW
jgi:hypothetical protein